MNSKKVSLIRYFISLFYKRIKNVPVYFYLIKEIVFCFILLIAFTSSAKENINSFINDNEAINHKHSIEINNTIVSSDDILKSMKEVGQAKLTKFFFDIYQSRLLTHSGKYGINLANTNLEDQKITQYNTTSKKAHHEITNLPIAFEITYLRNIRREYLVNETIKQWQHLTFIESSYASYIQILSDLWPDIKKGDKLLLYISDHSSVFYLNNEYLGEINDSHFGSLFLSIWLSPNTTEPKLRKQLLNL